MDFKGFPDDVMIVGGGFGRVVVDVVVVACWSVAEARVAACFLTNAASVGV